MARQLVFAGDNKGMGVLLDHDGKEVRIGSSYILKVINI